MLDFIALDLEGTLISNAMSQIPRPGLYSFIEKCAKCTSNLVLYSAVNPDRCRKIIQVLAQEGDVPIWFAEINIVNWDYRNHRAKKDLRLIQTNWTRGILVDDIEDYVAAEQLSSWVSISNYDGYTKNDDELERVAGVIAQRARELKL